MLGRLCALLLFAAPLAAFGAESPVLTDSRGSASLVSESDSVAPGHAVNLGLRLRLAPGWHTYWRNPGDAGIPPAIDWTLPRGASAGDIAWPTPMRMAEGPLVTYGYAGEVLLPVRVDGLGGAASIVAHASWLACKAVCVPEEATLRLDLPAGDGAAGPAAGLFRAAAAATPRPSPWPATIAPDGTLDISGPELGPERVRTALFVADDPDRVAAAGAQVLSVRPGALQLALRPASAPRFLTPLDGVLLLTDAGGQQSAYAVSARPGAVAASPGPLLPAAPGLASVLLLAFAGGLILNLMPCVFPVLAMKAVALARARQQSRGRALLGAAAYGLGVMVSFGALGGVLLAVRAAGGVAGWGFQFTHPVFVAGTALLLFVIGLNLSGAFALDRLGFLGVGPALAGRGGVVGSFCTGVLAVLVAAPCTAPFMGAALAAALAAPAALAMAVFAALGAGLAAPYVALAAVPGVSRLLPRPGAWMDVLRQALAFPMYASALWMLWVLGRLVGPDAIVLTAAAAIGLAFAVWLLPRVRGRAMAALVLAALCAGLWADQARLRALSTASATPSLAIDAAESFSPARLAALRGAGRPVLVDMTAAWCVTCLVNERVALDRAAVRAELARRDVTLLRGDWTRQDPGITAFLREQGRDGVPLYVFYPGGDRPPLRLPQILTESTVLQALRQASERPASG